MADSVRQAIQKCKQAMKYVFYFSAVINILNMFMPLYTLQVLDRVAGTGNLSTLFLLTLIVVSALTIMTVVEGSRRFILSRIGEWLEKELSRALLLEGFMLNASQNVLSGAQIIRDLSTVRSFISGNSCIGMFDAPWALLFFICVWMINPATGVVTVIGIISLVTFAIVSEKITTPIIKKINEGTSKNFQDLDSSSRCSETIEAMGMGANIADRWLKRQDVISEMNNIVSKRSTIIMLLLKYVRMLLQVFIYCAGVVYALKTGSTMGGVIACSILISKVLSPFESFVNAWKTIVNARVSYGRLCKVQQTVASLCSEYNTQLLPEIKGAIRAVNLVTAYQSTRQVVLKNISFRIEPGECLGVVGPNGAGKTTLLKAVMGLLNPMSGSVIIDDVEANKWGREYLGKYTGFVGQECVFFDATIRDNIARMSPDVSHETVVKAAKIAGIHDMIVALPKGYDTVMNAQSLLSAGQKQRIAMARAVFGDIRILILDEPNANLDREGEVHLVNVLSWAKENSITVIFTTHRMNLLQIADRVVILQNGTIVHSGTRDEVMAASKKAAAAAGMAEVKTEVKT